MRNLMLIMLFFVSFATHAHKDTVYTQSEYYDKPIVLEDKTRDGILFTIKEGYCIIYDLQNCIRYITIHSYGRFVGNEAIQIITTIRTNRKKQNN